MPYIRSQAAIKLQYTALFFQPPQASPSSTLPAPVGPHCVINRVYKFDKCTGTPLKRRKSQGHAARQSWPEQATARAPSYSACFIQIAASTPLHDCLSHAACSIQCHSAKVLFLGRDDPPRCGSASARQELCQLVSRSHVSLRIS